MQQSGGCGGVDGGEGEAEEEGGREGGGGPPTQSRSGSP